MWVPQRRQLLGTAVRGICFEMSTALQQHASSSCLHLRTLAMGTARPLASAGEPPPRSGAATYPTASASRRAVSSRACGRDEANKDAQRGRGLLAAAVSGTALGGCPSPETAGCGGVSPLQASPETKRRLLHHRHHFLSTFTGSSRSLASAAAFALAAASTAVFMGVGVTRPSGAEAQAFPRGDTASPADGSAPPPSGTAVGRQHDAHSGQSCQHHHDSPLWRSEESRPFEKKMEDALLFCGSSNPLLGAAVAERLSTSLGKVSLSRFADGEVNIQFLDSLRGKDVYIIQPTSSPVNDHLMELLLMISTCRRASAKIITAVIPYFGYARQDRKMNSRVPISAADVARMMEAMGVDRVVAVDLHCGQIQGFFGPRVPVDNVEAQIVGLDYFKTKKLFRPVVISPDAGGVYRARKFQEGLVREGYGDCRIAMLIKQRIRANEVESMELVGAVEGSDVIIVDDMIDTAGTLVKAARELRNKGARRVYAFATHGLFNGAAISRIESSVLEEVVVTDTIKAAPSVQNSPKITILSVSILLADAIRRIHQKESLNDLFNFSDVPKHDYNCESKVAP